jgi:hypothetical protein
MPDGQAPLAGDDVGRRFLPRLYRKVARLVVLALGMTPVSDAFYFVLTLL